MIYPLSNRHGTSVPLSPSGRHPGSEARTVLVKSLFRMGLIPGEGVGGAGAQGVG